MGEGEGVDLAAASACSLVGLGRPSVLLGAAVEGRSPCRLAVVDAVVVVAVVAAGGFSVVENVPGVPAAE